MQVIRELLSPDIYVIAVEHDLSVLDYVSDFICCLYGQPGAYGVVTMPFSVREGINIFLAGFVPTENLRFREDSLTFKVCKTALVLHCHTQAWSCLCLGHWSIWLHFINLARAHMVRLVVLNAGQFACSSWNPQSLEA